MNKEERTDSVTSVVGVRYFKSPQGDGSNDLPGLSHPMWAEEVGDKILFVDELQPWEHRVYVARREYVLFDSRTEGLRDCLATSFSDDTVIVLDRKKLNIHLLDDHGNLFSKGRLGLARKYSQWSPVCMTYSSLWQSLVIAMVDWHGQCIIVSHSIQSGETSTRLLSPTLLLPGSIQALRNGHLLIADAGLHCVREISMTGDVEWEFGQPGDPGNRTDQLSSPRGAWRSNRHTFIADTRNHRVLRVGLADLQVMEVAPNSFCSPSALKNSTSGLIVCDGGQGRIMRVQDRGIATLVGSPLFEERSFSFPRSVQAVDEDLFLVADTYNNRVALVSKAGVVVRELCSAAGVPLSWPRCAHQIPDGRILIADSRTPRILELRPDWTYSRQIHSFGFSRRLLGDPHSVSSVDQDYLLITDAKAESVFIADWSGDVLLHIGDGDGMSLSDPHSSRFFKGFGILVSDSGNHRVLHFDQSGDFVRSWTGVLSADGQFSRFRGPRCATVRDGVIFVADTDNDRIIGMSYSGQLLQIHSRVDARISRLARPRWVDTSQAKSIVFSDYYNHRLIVATESNSSFKSHSQVISDPPDPKLLSS